jgi:hypothetical protein
LNRVPETGLLCEVFTVHIPFRQISVQVLYRKAGHKRIQTSTVDHLSYENFGKRFRLIPRLIGLLTDYEPDEWNSMPGMGRDLSLPHAETASEAHPADYTVRLLIKLKATVTFRLPAGTARLTARRYKVFPIRVKYCSIKTVKSTYPFYNSSCREPGSDSCIQLYQWTHCTTGTGGSFSPGAKQPECEAHHFPLPTET